MRNDDLLRAGRNGVLAIGVASITVDRNSSIYWRNIKIDCGYFGGIHNDDTDNNKKSDNINNQNDSNPFVPEKSL